MKVMENGLRELVELYNPLNVTIDDRTRLYHDLNIYGDDAAELLSKISDLYKIDLSDFHFEEYFPNEGDWVFPFILRLITLRPKKIYKELTVGKLEKAIKAGVLK